MKGRSVMARLTSSGPKKTAAVFDPAGYFKTERHRPVGCPMEHLFITGRPSRTMINRRRSTNVPSPRENRGQFPQSVTAAGGGPSGVIGNHRTRSAGELSRRHSDCELEGQGQAEPDPKTTDYLVPRDRLAEV
jgi:hypothetical protein